LPAIGNTLYNIAASRPIRAAVSNTSTRPCNCMVHNPMHRVLHLHATMPRYGSINPSQTRQLVRSVAGPELCTPNHQHNTCMAHCYCTSKHQHFAIHAVRSLLESQTPTSPQLPSDFSRHSKFQSPPIKKNPSQSSSNPPHFLDPPAPPLQPAANWAQAGLNHT